MGLSNLDSDIVEDDEESGLRLERLIPFMASSSCELMAPTLAASRFNYFSMWTSGIDQGLT